MMRFRATSTAVAVAALVLVGCGDDGDTAEPTTTTSEATTTTEATPTTAAPTTTAEPTTTTTAAEPDTVDLAEFEGTWEGISFTVTSEANPDQSLDAIAFGASVTGDVDAAGNLTGQLAVPEAMGGSPEPIPFAARIEVVDAETMATTFEQEVPPFLTSFTGPFTYDGTTLALTDESGMFDFGTGVEPATTVITLQRVAG